MSSCTEIVTWKTVAPQMRRLNPVLATLIDKINPGDEYLFIKATYLFGDLILKEGKLQLPYSPGKLLPLEDPELDPMLKKHLGYGLIPLSVALNKTSEVFLTEDYRTVPLNILQPGQLFGTFEIVDFMLKNKYFPIWNVSAGARSTFMLPKINEASGLKRLRAQYQLSLDVQSKSLWDHWLLFKHIAQHTSTPWTSEVLFFSHDWFKQRGQGDPAWIAFYDYLFESAWRQAQYAMNEFKFGHFWQQCIKTISERKLKPSPYTINTIKHLWAIAMGVAPGFSVECSSLALPIMELQQAIMEVYRLDHYWPTIMSASTLKKSQQTVYYSLAVPTLFHGSTTMDRASSLMVEVRMIKLIMDSLKKKLADHPIVQHTHFEYFHTEKDLYHDIQLSDMIPEQDPNFKQGIDPLSGRSFCASSAFWRGCIRIHSTAENLAEPDFLVSLF